MGATAGRQGQAAHGAWGLRAQTCYRRRRRRGVHQRRATSLLALPLPAPCRVPSAGGYGPKLESWAFGVDQAGLEALLREGVFQLRTCKLCDDGVVVKGAL